MPSTQDKKIIYRDSSYDLVGAGGEPLGEPEARVLGTDVEIGGVSPVLEP